ncbi:SHOCT domain-containing protein [Haloferacaceae archaeon DSL9]
MTTTTTARRWLFAALLGVLVLALLWLAGMWSGMAGGWMMPMNGRGTTGWPMVFGFGFVGPLVALALLVAVGYLFASALGGSATESTADDALAELRAAYARGDLSDEEFHHRREVLRQDETR